MASILEKTISRSSRRYGLGVTFLLVLCCCCCTSTSSAFAPSLPAAFLPHSKRLDSKMDTPSSSKSSTSLFMAQRRGRPQGPLRTVEIKPMMNDEISYNELRVVTPNPDGGKDEALGIMTKKEALSKAKELGGLDLILINENSDPPVCKIVDYSKWRYEREKKAKEVKKNAKATEIKEVKMSYKIDVHDYDVRKKNASKFLNQGDRVKCTVMFRGREVQHDQLGFDLLDRLSTDLEKLAMREGKPKREGRNLSLILTPKPDVMKRISQEKRAEEKARKKMKEEKKAKKVGVVGAAAGGAAMAAEAAPNGSAPSEDDDSLLDSINLDEDEDDDDEDDFSSSLDDLLGSDDLTDELFG